MVLSHTPPHIKAGRRQHACDFGRQGLYEVPGTFVATQCPGMFGLGMPAAGNGTSSVLCSISFEQVWLRPAGAFTLHGTLHPRHAPVHMSCFRQPGKVTPVPDAPELQFLCCAVTQP